MQVPETPRPSQTSLDLAAMPSAVPYARGHVRAIAGMWGLAGIADTLELLASEIITNAIRVSAAMDTVRLNVSSDGVSVIISVRDNSPVMPTRCDAGPDQESGRGLALVDALSKDWGAERNPEGKTVWARVTIP